MDEAQLKLATEISEILKDNQLSSEERLLKMRSLLNIKLSNRDQVSDQDKKIDPPATYNNQAIKKAALRNQFINKDQK